MRHRLVGAPNPLNALKALDVLGEPWAAAAGAAGHGLARRIRCAHR